MKHLILTLGLAALVPLPDMAQAADTARVAIRADIRGTEPGVKRDSITDMVLHHVMEGLVAYDGDIRVQPLLAKGWTISEDGKSYTFDLREDVVFHNGAPMTSAEVKWSWERWIDKETGFRCTKWYDGSRGQKIESIETDGDYKVTFTLNKPNALFLDEMANVQCFTAIVHPDSLGADGAWNAPVGTGPYTLKEWKKGVSLTLETFEDYAKAEGPASGYAGAREALLKEVQFLVVPETTTALAGLRSGDIDLVPVIEPRQKLELDAVPSVVLHESPNLEWASVLLQTNDPLLSKPSMRLAIAHAIDFPALAQTTTLGIAKYNPSIVAMGSSYYNGVQAEGYTRDLAKVKELLAEAGYNGEALEIQTNRRYDYMYQNAIIIQAMLLEAGINSEIKVMEWPAHLDAYFKGNFQISSFGYSARTDPVLAYRAVMGDKTENPAKQWGDPQALTILSEAAASSDPAERQALFDTLHKDMIATAPILNLFNGIVIDATTDKVQGYSAWPIAKPRLWGVTIQD